jgi:peptide/nickel transport system permease protein
MWVGTGCMAMIVVCALLSGPLAPYDPIAIAPHVRLLAPSLRHLLGTDQLGRDVFSRVLAGSAIALDLVFWSVAIALTAGVILGLAAACGPRLLGGTIMLVCDSIMTLPMMLCALALATVIGPGLFTVGLVVTAFLAPAYARIVRGQSQVLIRQDYVIAARAMGAATLRVMLRHVLPNMAGPLLVQVAMDVPTVIGIEVGMTFLGQGAEPPQPSWGAIVSDGFSYIRAAPHIVLAGSLPIVIATVGCTFLAEALRDAMETRPGKDALS